LTTGLLDAAALGNCLIRFLVIHDLLMKYVDVRRKAWVKITNPEPTGFKYRVSSMNPEHVEERKRFFDAAQ
jgi:hypothetical protein